MSNLDFELHFSDKDIQIVSSDIKEDLLFKANEKIKEVLEKIENSDKYKLAFKLVGVSKIKKS